MGTVNINVFEGIDKVGKTTLVKELQKYLPNAYVIKNITPEQEKAIDLESSPIIKAALYSTFITYNWNELRKKADIRFPIEKDVTVLIDRWYSSTYAYQTAEVGEGNETAVQTIESFSLDKIFDFFEELNSLAKAGYKIKFNLFYLVPNMDLIKTRIAESKSIDIYENSEFLKRVAEQYELLIYLLRDSITFDYDFHENLSINIVTINQDLVEDEGGIRTLLNDFIFDSIPETVILTIQKQFFENRTVFSKADLENFCVSRFILYDNYDKLIQELIKRELIIDYSTGFTTVYFVREK